MIMADKTYRNPDVYVYDVIRTNIMSFGVLTTLRPRQNGHRFADDTLKRIFLNKNVIISIKISLKCVPKGPN